MEAIQTHNSQYVSTHQCYGLNIDLKLHNTYLRKLSTQFSISNRTLTQLLCRSAGAISSSADIPHWGRLQGLTWYQCLTAGWGEGADEAWGHPTDIGLSTPHLLSLAASCGVNHKFLEAASHLQQAQPQLRGSTHSVPCHSGPGHRLMTGSALFRTPGWQLPTHLVLHLSNTAQAQSRAAHSNSICAFEPKPVITATDSTSSPGGLWSVSRFQWCTIPARYANLAGPCHFEAGFSQEHSKAAPGAAEFQGTYLCCWNSLL